MHRRTLILTMAVVTMLGAGSAKAQIPDTERNALIGFFEATGGAGWTDSSGWLDPVGTECSWYGVVCDEVGQHVVELVLTSNNLEGHLPADLADLPYLVGLWLGREDGDLPDNHLGGEIPPELGSLEHLEYLSLWSNQIGGAIPPELGNLSSLLILDLDENPLSGEIPPELGNLAALEQLWMGGTLLSGGIPPELANLSALEVLSLWGNPLSGGIPPELGGLESLRVLWLSWTPLGGTIPPELGQLSNLEGIYLWEMGLEGEIPPELGQLQNLAELNLGFNFLSGPIPPELGQLTLLRRLSAPGNQLWGQIPVELSNLVELEELHLDWNLLEGPLPPELGSLSDLQFLGLTGNQLSGPLPVELGGLENLVGLYAAFNGLIGELPVELASLNHLQHIDLQWNQLSGMVPRELGAAGSLTLLDLSSNRLEGAIPAELGDLPALEYLHIRGNMLGGPIPLSFGQLTSLADAEGLDIRWNALDTDSVELANFLATKQLDVDWRSTQTLPPTELVVDWVGADAGEISWEPITYSWGGGGYRIFIALDAAGPYTLYGTTGSKEDDTAALDGLQQATTYYLALQTVTSPNEVNQNTVESHPSALVNFTTNSDTDCNLVCSTSVPISAEVGETVVFLAQVTASNCDADPTISWDLGDGSSAEGEMVEHAYDFTGTYGWSMVAVADAAQCTASASVAVSYAGTECGNGSCELGESAWTCAADCGLDANETGRTGQANRVSAVPAAVGGVAGENDTFWLAEAMIHNPGEESAVVVISFSADSSPGETLTAGPFELDAGAASFYANVVMDLFNVNDNGSMIINSDQPLIYASRVFNSQPDRTYGQFLGAVGANRIFGIGDRAYLVGLSENSAFRTNVLVQEVAGRESTVRLSVYDEEGDAEGSYDLTVPAGGKKQVRLQSIGFDDLSNAYGTVEVISGGRVVTVASVVDGITGDAMTVDAMHTDQVMFGAASTKTVSFAASAEELTAAEAVSKVTSGVDFTWSPSSPAVAEVVSFVNLSTIGAISYAWNFGDGTSSSEENPTHSYTAAGTYPVTLVASTGGVGSSFVTKTITVQTSSTAASRYLVAVVAHLEGSAGTQWRSDLWLLNPIGSTQTVELAYRPDDGSGLRTADILVPGGHQVVAEDLVGVLFPGAGNSKGSLQIRVDEGVLANSRTYNLGGEGTFGQAIPALGGGDLVAVAETGCLLKLKSTSITRCNLGFAEFDGIDSQVRVRLYAITEAGVEELGSADFDVLAGQLRQVNQIFAEMDLDGEYEAAYATVEVIAGGRIFAYASNVDERTGDGEFIPAMVY